MKKVLILSLLVVATSTAPGCHFGGAAESFGKTYYLDGAGNWGWGTSGVTRGLKEAGYEGDVEVFIWTTSLNPLIDQWNFIGARIRAAGLAGKIHRYRRKYPDNQINIVSLSAGSGVATWAVENLKGDTKIDNMVLLGSSLSAGYDMSRALSHMNGRIFVYHSSQDVLLDSIKIIGTVDGKLGVESAGSVGLFIPPGYEGRIVNIPWSRKWLEYGWSGGHLDCASASFVRDVVSRHLMEARTASFDNHSTSDETSVVLTAFPPS